MKEIISNESIKNFVLLALVLVVALVACGGEKTPDITEAPVTTTKAPTYVPAEPEPICYESLYVGYNTETGTFENTTLFMEFFSSIESSMSVQVYTPTYVADGVSAKLPAGAKWANGCIDAGVSAVNLESAINHALGEDKAYTVQIVAKRSETSVSPMTAYVGANVELRQSESLTVIRYMMNGSEVGRFPDYKMYDPAGYTFIIDRAAEEGNFTIYANTTEVAVLTHEFKEENTLAAFKGAPYYLYAVRVYDYALSDDEIAQNNFADIAMSLELDVTDFINADEEIKLSVYEAFDLYSFDTLTKDEAQDILDIMLS